jgi:predicted PurR-regulated permease PerM
LKDGAKLRQFVISLSPLADSYDELVLSRLGRAVNSVLKGTLTIALIQGVVSALGYMLFGVPNPLLWGTVTAIAALVPGVGTALILTPIVLFLFLTGNVPGAIGLAVWGAFAVGLVDNFLSPHLIGGGSQLHPLLVLISVLGGIGLFGAVGIFLGPLCLSLFMALLSIYADITDENPKSA